MYNQFTALDQKPLNMGKIILNPMEIPKNKKKKKKLHSKNPYKIKKIKLRGQQAMAEKFVDGLLLLKMLHFEHPKQVISANISYKKIVQINADHLQYFTNMTQLNCSQNYIPLQQLRKLPAIQNINISHNQIRQLNLQSGGFQKLKKLNLSFNYLQYQFMTQLTLLPNLVDLDLSYNELAQIPQDLTNFNKLKKLNLQGNQFKSDYKASAFWASLASLPSIQIISVSRNKIRGIHTQKLIAGNFSTLIQLDFSYNSVQNQHNLICARNFISLKKLYITGNPFVQLNQFKGLQMQIYARTGAQVIIQKVNPYYLRQQKQKRPQIKFEKFVTVKPTVFHKKKNILFGLELPKDDQLFSSQTQEQQEEQQIEESSQSEQEEAMFVTEQINQKAEKQKKNKHSATNSKKEQQNHISENSQNFQNLQSSGSILNEQLLKKSGTSSLRSQSQRSIDYGQFHKVAAQLLGGQKQIKKGFDIHTSYKALKKALDRAEDDF